MMLAKGDAFEGQRVTTQNIRFNMAFFRAGVRVRGDTALNPATESAGWGASYDPALVICSPLTLMKKLHTSLVGRMQGQKARRRDNAQR